MIQEEKKWVFFFFKSISSWLRHSARLVCTAPVLVCSLPTWLSGPVDLNQGVTTTFLHFAHGLKLVLAGTELAWCRTKYNSFMWILFFHSIHSVSNLFLLDVIFQQIVPPVLDSFSDQDSRVRYYACEALYNIAKVSVDQLYFVMICIVIFSLMYAIVGHNHSKTMCRL